MNVFAMNLKLRTDRKKHIIDQFSDKPEFNLSVVPAIEHEIGAFGLWQTILQIVRSEKDKGNKLLILCEDDHEFTKNYSFEILEKCISEALSLNADILSGGYSWFENAVQVSDHLFWVDIFNGMQFTIIFERFYQRILDAGFGSSVVADLSLSSLTDNKFVMHPYISIQKEFGYSDVTSKNNEKGYVSGLFNDATKRLESLDTVKCFYFPNQSKS